MYFIYGQDLMTGLAPLRLLPKIRGSTERQMEKNGKHTKRKKIRTLKIKREKNHIERRKKEKASFNSGNEK